MCGKVTGRDVDNEPTTCVRFVSENIAKTLYWLHEIHVHVAVNGDSSMVRYVFVASFSRRLIVQRFDSWVDY